MSRPPTMPAILHCLAAVALLSAAVLAKAQTTTTHTLRHDGTQRTYRLFLPSGYAVGEAVPLVLNLHGRGSTGQEQQFYAGLDLVADTAGFAVCYPDGLGEEWNVGWSFGARTDDVGFLTTLIDTLQAAYGFDDSRTYSIGMSNGGFMSYVLACEIPERLAGIASVTGGMLAGRRTSCQPDVPMPVMQVHGTADGVVAYTGTDGVNEPTEATVAGWAALNGCRQNPTTTPLPDAEADGLTSERVVYEDCAGEAEVQLIRVAGGGHTWPGSVIDIAPGRTTYDFSASREIWTFLRRFSRVTASALPPDGRTWTPALEVWPNPARWGQLSLKPADYARDLELVDARGHVVKQWSIAGGATRVDLGVPVAGVYWLRERGGGVGRLIVE